LTLTQAAVRPAQAEIDLGTWETYATMAEKGAVCGAFPDIMAVQVLVDEKLGRLLVASIMPIFLGSSELLRAGAIRRCTGVEFH